jgi:hypothetical protein
MVAAGGQQPPEPALLFPLAMRAGLPNCPTMDDTEQPKPQLVEFASHRFYF